LEPPNPIKIECFVNVKKSTAGDLQLKICIFVKELAKTLSK